ncbi:hypothetical protein C8R43DRAFT_1009148 [Mycena crocata]|nr:hypothetical protein C8R43DRAFT_1009148 [Mycena crocata]
MPSEIFQPVTATEALKDALSKQPPPEDSPEVGTARSSVIDQSRSSQDPLVEQSSLQDPVVVQSRSPWDSAVDRLPVPQDIDSSQLALLVQEALCSIAEEHKKKAEGLGDGNPSGDPRNMLAIYIEYRKYLHIYPCKDEADYKNIWVKVNQLEEDMGFTPSGPVQDPPKLVERKRFRWSRFLDPLTIALAPFRSRAVPRNI